jgi:oligopeptide transport system permease protein
MPGRFRPGIQPLQKMLRFIAKRLLSAIPTIFVVVTISFFLIRFAPGGPFTLERALAPQIMENMMRAYHLNEPLWLQYLNYLWNALHGDFGPSYIYRDFTVAELIRQGLPYSMTLGTMALAVALVGGVTVGIFAALRQNGIVDHGVMAAATVGLTVPNFVVGPVLSLVFAVSLSWASSGGWGSGSPRDLALPMVTLALPSLAVFARLTRGSMIEALRTDHVRTARAYGLPRRVVVVVHALRGALLPVVSYLAPAAAHVLTGSVVVETIFAIPGVGRYFVLGALNRDYTLVMATVVLVAVFIIVFNLIVDLLYAVLDPRVRYD